MSLAGGFGKFGGLGTLFGALGAKFEVPGAKSGTLGAKLRVIKANFARSVSQAGGLWKGS